MARLSWTWHGSSESLRSGNWCIVMQGEKHVLWYGDEPGVRYVGSLQGCFTYAQRATFPVPAEQVIEEEMAYE